MLTAFKEGTRWKILGAVKYENTKLKQAWSSYKQQDKATKFVNSISVTVYKIIIYYMYTYKVAAYKDVS